MGAAFGWGLLAASSLVIGAIVSMLFPIPLRVIGLIMGFGAGVLKPMIRDRKSTRLNSSHTATSRMPSSA